MLVRVRGGYEPDTIRVRVGEPVRIVFRREETAPCSEHVVFPDFGKSAMLPPFQDVSLELQPDREGEYEFTCQLGILRGLLIVETGESPRRKSVITPMGYQRTRRWHGPGASPSSNGQGG